MSDRLPEHVHPGETIEANLHVVNDLRAPLVGAIVVARAMWEGGSREWRFQGDVDADSCAKVGTVRFAAPDTVGVVVLDLTLEHNDMAASNRYGTRVASH